MDIVDTPSNFSYTKLLGVREEGAEKCSRLRQMIDMATYERKSRKQKEPWISVDDSLERLGGCEALHIYRHVSPNLSKC